mmetsp:Transcript_41255/g.89091  ORF Transcript_41255/g.89091 Transcript_41255/m.89091 type:complete len:378 (-) Transcript_41255:186-1319(-)
MRPLCIRIALAASLVEVCRAWRPTKGSSAAAAAEVGSAHPDHPDHLRHAAGASPISSALELSSDSERRSDRVGLSSGRSESSSLSGVVEEAAFRAQRTQMLSQLTSSRETLLHLALGKLDFLHWLGSEIASATASLKQEHRRSGSNSSSSSSSSSSSRSTGSSNRESSHSQTKASMGKAGAALDTWELEKRSIFEACDTSNLPNMDGSLLLKEDDPREKYHKDILAQIDSTKLVRDNLLSCSKAVDQALDGMKEQFATSLAANKNYVQSFETVLGTLDDFKKTATLTKAFNSDHKAASRFLLANLDLVQKDIDKLRKIRPEHLDSHALDRAKEYEKAKEEKEERSPDEGLEVEGLENDEANQDGAHVQDLEEGLLDK